MPASATGAFETMAVDAETTTMPMPKPRTTKGTHRRRYGDAGSSQSSPSSPRDTRNIPSGTATREPNRSFRYPPSGQATMKVTLRGRIRIPAPTGSYPWTFCK